MNWKRLVAALVCAASLGALADVANALVGFSTTHDLYADGTPVLDGEWYALVWSPDGQFDGLTTACRAVDAADRVLITAPLAKDGHCPYVIFQVDARLSATSGVYSVYLIDTRSADGRTVARRTAEGLPALVNGAIPSKTCTATSVSAGGATARAPTTAGTWAASSPTDAQQPTITAFCVADGRVRISARNIQSGIKYNVTAGPSPDRLDTYALDVPQMTDDGQAEFDLTADAGRFFRIVREPLARRVDP